MKKSTNLPPDLPKLYPLKPFHERLLAYQNTRRKIFKRSRSTDRARKFWTAVKQKQKHLNEICSIFQQPNDIRPYATVKILGKSYLGLLDSGATISCIGADFANELLAVNKHIKNIDYSIRTADGTKCNIAGVIKLDVTYKSDTKNVEFYIIPSLIQNLYLGVNFWKVFKIATNIVSEIEVCEMDENKHPLSLQQQQVLSAAISYFPNFEERGLGKTSLVEHTIDVGDAKPIKQRHFPISPAVEKLM